METLSEQFADCLSRWVKIEVPPASKAHKEVRDVLEKDSQLKGWGVDTILIGSYARDVSIFPCNDVDVFTKLPMCTESDPERVFTALQRALVAHYKGRAKEQRRSIMVVGFENGLSVDAVPAVRESDHWKIPQTDAARVKNQWEKTNPERLTKLTQERNAASPKVNGSGSYVPIVKLVRQCREHHLGEAKPGGLYFEFLAYWAFTSGVTGGSLAEILANTLNIIAGQLESGAVVLDPAVGAPFAPTPSVVDLRRAAKSFRDLASEAAEALQMEKCPAAATWREILGSNPRGRVFPLPSGCDETGKAIGTITINRDRGSDESRPFA